MQDDLSWTQIPDKRVCIEWAESIHFNKEAEDVDELDRRAQVFLVVDLLC